MDRAYPMKKKTAPMVSLQYVQRTSQASATDTYKTHNNILKTNRNRWAPGSTYWSSGGGGHPLSKGNGLGRMPQHVAEGTRIAREGAAWGPLFRSKTKGFFKCPEPNLNKNKDL